MTQLQTKRVIVSVTSDSLFIYFWLRFRTITWTCVQILPKTKWKQP